MLHQRGRATPALMCLLFLLLFAQPAASAMASEAFIQPAASSCGSSFQASAPGKISSAFLCGPTSSQIASPLANFLERPVSQEAGRTRQQTMALPSIGRILTAVPRFVGRKIMDGGDAIYVKKSLFLPPGSRSSGTSSPQEDTSSQPPTSVEADMVLVLFPGIGMGPAAYRETALAIQDALAANYDVKAYVVVAKFFNNLGYLPQEPERRLASILTEVSLRGVSARAPVAVAGHSAGAFLAYEAALTRSQAFVHLGSTLNSRGVLPWKPRSVLAFPKPILQLLGEMDGYIRFTGGALEYAEVESLMAKKGFEDALLDKPVVLLPGVSHQQFGDGSQSKAARMSGRRDLPPYVALQEAHRMTGKIVASFLAYHLFPLNGRARVAGASVLRQAFEATGRMVRPYLDESTPQAEDDFIRWAQAEVASVEGVGRNSVRALLYESEGEFVYSKPFLDTESEYLQVCVRKVQEAAIRIGFTKQISPALDFKMKRQEAVVQALRRYPSKKAPTAAELNHRTFQKALEKVSEEARRRYDRYGRKLEFIADDEITAERGGGPAWVATPLEVKARVEDPMRVTVRSPVLYTPIDTLPRFAGMCYMKLLTPAQAVEWICHDAYVPWGTPK
ncbi:hypothetical protein Naga_100042g35 [Nannochloropsis gaditana]|uniref:Alpha/beta hydrolase family protein n=1 Tax=Nannochloropsis gaditana TaxID=72520 RepID=W7U0V4_9STRA|nr:hypothetical protein Naga_100042g35 [Nannochloropsis gaditana]